MTGTGNGGGGRPPFGTEPFPCDLDASSPADNIRIALGHKNGVYLSLWGKKSTHLVTGSVTSEVLCLIIKGNSQRKRDSREELGFSPNRKKRVFFLTERKKKFNP